MSFSLSSNLIFISVWCHSLHHVVVGLDGYYCDRGVISPTFSVVFLVTAIFLLQRWAVTTRTCAFLEVETCFLLV